MSDDTIVKFERRKINEWPRRVYLADMGDGDGCRPYASIQHPDDTTPHYVRGDLYDALLAERDALRAELSSGSFYKESDIDALEAERDELRRRVEAEAEMSSFFHTEGLKARAEAFELQQKHDELRRQVEALRAALERAATLAEDGFMCRRCGSVFTREEGDKKDCCDRPMWDEIPDWKLAEVISESLHACAGSVNQGTLRKSQRLAASDARSAGLGVHHCATIDNCVRCISTPPVPPVPFSHVIFTRRSVMLAVVIAPVKFLRR